MTQIEKLCERLLEKPKDFTWDELVRILGCLGYKALKAGKAGGSRRKFKHRDKGFICLHEPHPRKVLKRYQLEQVIAHLEKEGLL